MVLKRLSWLWVHSNPNGVFHSFYFSLHFPKITPYLCTLYHVNRSPYITPIVHIFFAFSNTQHFPHQHPHRNPNKNFILQRFGLFFYDHGQDLAIVIHCGSEVSEEDIWKQFSVATISTK